MSHITLMLHFAAPTDEDTINFWHAKVRTLVREVLVGRLRIANPVNWNIILETPLQPSEVLAKLATQDTFKLVRYAVMDSAPRA